MKALEDSIQILETMSIQIDINNDQAVQEVVQSSIDTKFVSRWGTLISDLAIKAAKTVMEKMPDGRVEIDIKRYAKVEKIPGGDLTECEVLNGVMFNKDITHPRMR